MADSVECDRRFILTGTSFEAVAFSVIWLNSVFSKTTEALTETNVLCSCIIKGIGVILPIWFNNFWSSSSSISSFPDEFPPPGGKRNEGAMVLVDVFGILCSNPNPIEQPNNPSPDPQECCWNSKNKCRLRSINICGWWCGILLRSRNVSRCGLTFGTMTTSLVTS